MEGTVASTTLTLAPEARGRRTKATQAAEVIKQRIKRGIYQPGEQLPSIRTLCRDMNLTLPAIQRAVRQLEVEGLLESQHGIGIRILNSADCRDTPLIFGFVQPYFSYFSLALQHYLEDALDSRSNLCVIKSTHNEPERERQQISKLISSGVNGLLVWPVDGDSNGAFLQDVAKRLPVVFVDRTIEGVRAPSVVLGYQEVGRQIVRHVAKAGRKRILMVCDPINISSFNQLKAGMREAVDKHHGKMSLTLLDESVVAMIDASYKGDYSLADRSYAYIASMLDSGDYDAIFCPHSEYFDLVFAYGDRPATLGDIARITFRAPESPPQSRRYYDLGVDEWNTDTAKMMVLALDLLQTMTLAQNVSARTIRVPIMPVGK